MLTGLFFLIVGGLEALVIRLQLAVPNNHFVTPDTFNQLFTMHGTTMIFLVAMPLLFGFVNYILPLQIGARDMAFPRLNAFGYLVPAIRRNSFALQYSRRRRSGGRLVLLCAVERDALFLIAWRRLLGDCDFRSRSWHDQFRGQHHRHRDLLSCAQA